MPPPQRLALLLHYDGAPYAGSQTQPNLPTIQSALQHAIAQLTREHPIISFAGRTDAGVHALGQVASFQTGGRLTNQRWQSGLNHHLPDTIAVQAVQTVPDRFDPRRDARERTYRYRLLVAAQPRPLEEPQAWRIHPPFSVETARRALQLLIGRRDFAAFTTTGQKPPTTRFLRAAAIHGGPQRYTISFAADSFLQHQVRRMVGAVVQVARGKSTLDAFRATLNRAKPGSAAPTAPAKALTLAHVRYDQTALPPWPTDTPGRPVEHNQEDEPWP